MIGIDANTKVALGIRMGSCLIIPRGSSVERLGEPAALLWVGEDEHHTVPSALTVQALARDAGGCQRCVDHFFELQLELGDGLSAEQLIYFVRTFGKVCLVHKHNSFFALCIHYRRPLVARVGLP
jgi:hypothetical protein